MFVRITLLMTLAALVGCGDDGVDPCPNGCDLPGSTIVKWKFNAYPELSFDSDACTEVQAANVRVEVVGVTDSTVIQSVDKACSEFQATFVDLPVQDYNVSVTPLDAAGASLVGEPGRGMTPAGTSGAPETITVPVQYENWSRDYLGQFLYKFRWNAMTTCPVNVVTQRTKLTVDGVVVTAMNNRGDKLDGTTTAPCTGDMTPLNAMNVPFGPATFEISGLDGGGVVTFTETFQTFVGAGMFNPTLSFDVNPVM